MRHPYAGRRHWLHQTLALATTLWLPRSAWTAQRFDSDLFALGVVSGSPTHDGVVLWTRPVTAEGNDASLPAGHTAKKYDEPEKFVS
ncbi:MAG: hypothetical protein AUJ20_07835 [Comamonadaceae bacterium CG1_02_60_18]|nr:MAG: hypothetical protein AUJ20_07835 [Comamonadaceae bacterium CG1_02_60_18]PIQ52107.1 MAG: hypothetical protein COW02_11160 [Comamonadaceae bacterium CG12_big_fil_rev_8_21_14_0_65_59_15]